MRHGHGISCIVNTANDALEVNPSVDDPTCTWTRNHVIAQTQRAPYQVV